MAIIAGLASAVAAQGGIYQADTPEVYAAKQQFAAAYNQAARQAAAASPNRNYAPAPAQPAAYVAQPAAYQDADPGNTYPAAEPYIHQEYAAEPYVHVEVPAEPYVHIEPARKRGGQAIPAAPVQPAAPTYINNPQPAAYNQYNNYNQYGGCINWKGEGVPCRNKF